MTTLLQPIGHAGRGLEHRARLLGKLLRPARDATQRAGALIESPKVPGAPAVGFADRLHYAGHRVAELLGFTEDVRDDLIELLESIETLLRGDVDGHAAVTAEAPFCIAYRRTAEAHVPPARRLVVDCHDQVAKRLPSLERRALVRNSPAVCRVSAFAQFMTNSKSW